MPAFALASVAIQTTKTAKAVAHTQARRAVLDISPCTQANMQPDPGPEGPPSFTVSKYARPILPRMKAAELRSLLGTRVVAAARWAPPVRWLSGAVFVVFGIGKFSEHAHEVDSFESYGLPSPDAFVYAVGALEVGGGLLLLMGLMTRLAALLLAANMVGAIISSGIGEGEVLPSLTLAPLLLVAMLFLLWVGPGERALDGRLLTRRRQAG